MSNPSLPPVEPAPLEHSVQPVRLTWLDPLCAALSVLIPVAVTLSRLSVGAQWRDDLPVVRGLGLVPIAGEGSITAVLTQVAALIPVGGRLMRAALVSALGLAVAGRLTYGIALRLLRTQRATPRLSPPLALAASLTTVLAAAWQSEGTIAGGATIAAALGLYTLSLRRRSQVADARSWAIIGGLVGLTLSESHAAGGALAIALFAQLLIVRDFPTRRVAALAGAACAVGFAVCALPLVIRPLAPRSWVHLGYALSTGGVGGADFLAERSSSLAAWTRDVGVISLGLALFGAAFGLFRSKTRWLVVPWIALVAVDSAFPAALSAGLTSDQLASLRLMAVAGIGVCSVLGVHAASGFIGELKVPMARPAAGLLVAFSFVLVLMSSEDSAHRADATERQGAETFTDEALTRLPYRSILLVRSHAMAWRLWAARVVRGTRPDIVVVPVPMLERGSVATRLLVAEPTLGPLIRDAAIQGRPGEYAMSTLADARPLYVELDPRWDKRLMHHLTPEPMWLGFAPTALGQSDRHESMARVEAAFERVLAVANRPAARDQATLGVLGARTLEQARILMQLRDYPAVEKLAVLLKKIDPSDPELLQLEKALAARKAKLAAR